MKREFGQESPHYSEKGGHGARSDYHRLIRDTQKPRMLSFFNRVPVDINWIARRSMFRAPQDGRR